MAYTKVRKAGKGRIHEKRKCTAINEDETKGNEEEHVGSSKDNVDEIGGEGERGEGKKGKDPKRKWRYLKKGGEKK